ncbi:kinase-like domain-containing protein [Melampsora americana]|nr:kinase-like domain-containing protein [Melampsora americana]
MIPTNHNNTIIHRTTSSKLSRTTTTSTTTPTIKPISISTSPTSTISTATSSSSSSTTSSSSSENQHHHLNQPDYQPTTKNDNNNNNSSSSLPHDIFSITDEELAAQYTFENEIGYGNWGSIWRISTNPSTKTNPPRQKKTLAIKLVHRDKSSNTTNARVKSLWGEFKTLRRFKSNPSPNVLRISSFIITPSYALLTMAFHPALLPVRLSESNPKTIPYLRGLLSGIEFLHRHHITHNDIKPANVVISEQDQPVFIDFGFAVSYGSDWEGAEKGEKKYWSQLSWGTPEYLSPQRARGEPHDERLSDIWSLGITMYEVVVGRTPFESDDHEEFLTKEALQVYYERTLTGEFLGVHHLSRLLKDLLKLMIQPDPKRRLTSCANGILHPYFEPCSSTPHSRRSVIGSSIQDRLKAFESKQAVPTPTLINKPIQQLVTNTKIKLESKSSIKVFRDQPELNTKTPSKKDSVPARVLTPQCQNTPPVATTTKRVPVPYSKLHPHQQENLHTERTPTLASGRTYVTKTPAPVKHIINAESKRDSSIKNLNKEDDWKGEQNSKELNVSAEERARPKTMKDDMKAEQEEGVYQPLKSATGLRNESMKRNRVSNQSCDRDRTLTPKDQLMYRSIGSNATATSFATATVTRMKSPRKELNQRPITARPKTAGPSIQIQSEGVSRYRPRSANGQSASENNEVNVGPKKLFKDQMEMKSDRKPLGLGGIRRLKETEQKVGGIGLDVLKSGTPIKNTSITNVRNNRMSLSTSPNVERTRSLIKRQDHEPSKIPMSQTRIRTTSVRVSSVNINSRSGTMDVTSKTTQTSPTPTTTLTTRRRTSSSINPRTTIPCKMITPMKKERITTTTPTSHIRVRTTSVRIQSGKVSKGIGSSGKKSSMKAGSKQALSSSMSPNLKIKRSPGQVNNPNPNPSPNSNRMKSKLSNSNPSTPNSRLNTSSHHHHHHHPSSNLVSLPRSRSCLIGPSSLIK